MSVTISAIPLAFLFTSLAATKIAAEAVNAIKNISLGDENEKILNQINSSDGKCFLSQENLKLLSQELETPFVSNELLVRTIEEYGIKIIENKDTLVTAKIERLIINFSREDKTLPYKMKFIFPDDCLEMQKDIVKNLYEEYGTNTQEEAYIQIKEKIEKSNMYIADEEILEDDSIVLTINVD